MNFSELQAAMPALMSGAAMTAKVLFLAIIGGMVLGTILALMRLSNSKTISTFAKLYVNFFRSVPLLLVLMWFYFAVPMVYKLVTGQFLTLDTAFVSCVVAFMVFEAAYFSEIVRAGIQSIGKGQVNAAKALGMNYNQTMRYVILPQAFRKMFPLLLQQSIILFQDTTLVFAIGLVDFFRASYVRGDLMGFLTQYILLAGFVYWIVSFTLSTLVNHLKTKLRTS